MKFRKVMSLLMILIIFLSIGCEQDRNESETLTKFKRGPDINWLQQNLIEGNAKPRLEHGMLESGFYQPILGFDWLPKPLAEQKGSLISQNRFIYLMVMAYEVTGEKNYRDAMIKAANFLLLNFAIPDRPGFWFRKIASDGSSINRGFHAYGYTQVIFALSHAFQVTQDSRYLDAAMQTWLAMDIPGAISGQNKKYELHGLNVAKHLFESLLVLYKATDSNILKGELQALGDYIVGHFYDPENGVFVEELTNSLERKQDGEIRLGHAIEMAFLLSRSVDAGLPASYLQPANHAVDFVANVVAINEYHLIPDTTEYNGTIRDPEYYWWSQAELLRGLAHFVWHRERTELKAQFYISLSSVQQSFIDHQYGGWYRKPNATEEDKGQEWKVGYHVTMMLTELMRLQRVKFKSGSEVLL